MEFETVDSIGIIVGSTVEHNKVSEGEMMKLRNFNFSKYENVLIITGQEEISKARELFDGLGEDGLVSRCLLLVTGEGNAKTVNPIVLSSIKNADHVIKVADAEYEGA